MILEEIQSFFKMLSWGVSPFFHQVIYVSRGINNAELTLFSGASAEAEFVRV